MTEEGGDPRGAATQPAGARVLHDLVPGVMIAERYRLEEPLGRGAMGLVVAARHVSLNQRVALKFLQIDDGARQFRTRFAREARVCAKLRNEHVVRVMDFGTYRENAVYMVMECLDGEDLGALFRRNGRLELGVAVDYVVQACEGLAEVHANGVVHRDLKPSNLFVTERNDGTKLIKILDFGISKWADPAMGIEADLTETGTVLGTPRFMSPEQLFGSSTVDARADVWSLGAIVYQLLTGRPPFEASSLPNLCALLAAGAAPVPPSTLRPELSAAIDAAVLQCLERELDRRTPDVAELAGSLLAAIGSSDAEAVREKLRATLDASKVVSLSKTGSAPALRVAPPVKAQPSRRFVWIGALLAVAATILALALTRRADPVATPAAQPPVASAAPSVSVAAASPSPCASPSPSPSLSAAPSVIAVKPQAFKQKPAPSPLTVAPVASVVPLAPKPSATPGMFEERQ